MHQGSVRREEQCPSCRGEVLIKVFDCELHGQCTWARAIEEIVCCAKCADYAVPACDQNADQA